MNKVIYKGADGSKWAGVPYRTDVSVDEAVSSGGTVGGYGSGVWDTIKGEINGWANTTFNGISNIVAAKNQQPAQDNTPKVLAVAGVGVAAVILVIVLVLILKK